MRELSILQNLKLNFSEDKVPLENCALLGYYRASNGNFLPTFRENLSVSSSGFKKGVFLAPRMGRIICPETSVRNYHYRLRNNPEERISQLFRGGSLKSRKFPPM